FLPLTRPPHLLPSFPTRRSSDLPKMPRFFRWIVQLARIVEIKHNLLAVFGRAIQFYDDLMSESGIRSWGFSCRDRSRGREFVRLDRKSTRLNSSHQIISYAVFCL